MVLFLCLTKHSLQTLELFSATRGALIRNFDLTPPIALYVLVRNYVTSHCKGNLT